MDGVDAMGEAMNIIRMDEAGSIAAMSGLEGNMTRKNASRCVGAGPTGPAARAPTSNLRPPTSPHMSHIDSTKNELV